MPDPRQYDLVIRSTITGLISLIIIAVVSIEALRGERVDSNLVAWGGIIIGVYFGAHNALNGSGVRAARDNQLTAQLLSAGRAPEPGETTVTTTTGGNGG